MLDGHRLLVDRGSFFAAILQPVGGLLVPRAQWTAETRGTVARAAAANRC
jgi:hypothetical protein